MDDTGKRRARSNDKTESSAPLPESDTESSTAGEKKGSREVLPLMQRLLHDVARELSNKASKATMADLVRLVQLCREMEGDQPKEVTVRWVEENLTQATDYSDT